MKFSKNSLLALTLLLFASYVTSCTAPEVGDQFLSLKGNIENYQGEQIELIAPGVRLTTPVIDGHFEIEIPDSLPPNLYQIHLETADIPVFMIPNRILEVHFDAENIEETLEYSGKTARESKYFWHQSNNRDYESQEKRFSIIDKNLFLKESDAYYAQKIKALDTLKDKKLDKYFYALAKSDIGFQQAEEKIYYTFYQEESDLVDNQFDDEYFSFLDDLKYDQMEFVQLPSYASFITALVYHKADNSYNSTLQEKMAVLNKYLKNPEAKENAIYDQLLFQLKYLGIEGAEKEYNDFMTGSKKNTYKETLKGLYNDWKLLSKGNMAPIINGIDKDGNEVSTADLKGKVLYIDVWATWCGPCVGEIPYLDAIREKYKDDNKFKVISISIDKDKQKWLTYLNEKHSTGTHWWVEDAFGSEVCKDYLIKGIPRFILIDAEGKIISAGAPRPSEKEDITQLIESAK